MIDWVRIPYQKALVTGGAGFIGSHIVEELVNNGIELSVWTTNLPASTRIWNT